MKKLIFRKVKIARDIPTPDISWLRPRIGPFTILPRKNKKEKEKKKTLAERIREEKDNQRRTQWVVKDKDSGDILDRFDSFEQAKQFCIKNDYDFGQYL